MNSAVAKGLTTEAVITAALRRTQRQLFRAGRYDPPAEIGWSGIWTDVVNSTQHRAVQHEAALQALVLLKNANGTLPLKAGGKVAVLGPQGVTRKGLLSDYYGDDVCYTSSCSGKGCFDCIPTVAEAVAAANAGGSTTSAAGVDVNSRSTSGVAAALALGRGADAIVLVLGTDKTIEHEGHDRGDTALPGKQADFAAQVLALGRPTVLVLTNGGQLAIDGLTDGPGAIVEAFNPSVGGAAAIADTLFGRANRWGKLPYTMYPHAYISQQPMSNYNMSKPPGRTYRYYTGTPLFPFGHGLSYASFTHTCSAAKAGEYSCDVRNTGGVAGDEVVMVFHAAGDAVRAAAPHPVPLRRLVGFERVTVAPGGAATAAFALGEDALKLVNQAGDRVLYKGEHHLIFSRGNGADVTFSVQV